MYYDYPLEQGLRLRPLWLHSSAVVLWLSIRTRIKTPCNSLQSSPLPKYYDYPLEQGLRRIAQFTNVDSLVYYDYPLEQGLRHIIILNLSDTIICIMIIH